MSWQKVLGHSSLQISDFYSYFYEVFFLPYSKGVDYFLYVQNPNLAENYLTHCFQSLQGADQAICEYGTIGLQLANGQFTGLESSLLSLVETYPQGYLYQALGEFYLRMGDTISAKYYLLKSVGMISSMEEGYKIRSLLQQVM